MNYRDNKAHLALSARIIFLSLWLINVTLTLPANNDSTAFSSEVSITISEGTLKGTLVKPSLNEKFPAVIIIPGSGPTNRDGNSMMGMWTNMFKMLADSLADHGIASLRYDKRSIGESKVDIPESEVVFDDMVNDAVQWIKFLQDDTCVSEIFIIGHSEGSLIGMLAAKHTGVHGLISLAGPGRPADEIIKEQLKRVPDSTYVYVLHALDSLKTGMKIQHVAKGFASLFRPGIQPYLINWFQYDPAEILACLNIPILIIQGTTDLQVPKSDAEILAAANKNSSLVIIEGMNHVLKNAPDERMENLATYNNPNLPLNKNLVESIVEFIIF